MKTPAKSMLTISHQYGSGGSRIARDLGSSLHWAVWDKEVVRKIASQYQVSEEYVDAKDERVEKYCRLLYDEAVIAEGSRVKDPVALARRINELLVRDAGT